MTVQPALTTEQLQRIIERRHAVVLHGAAGSPPAYNSSFHRTYNNVVVYYSHTRCRTNLIDSGRTVALRLKLEMLSNSVTRETGNNRTHLTYSLLTHRFCMIV